MNVQSCFDNRFGFSTIHRHNRWEIELGFEGGSSGADTNSAAEDPVAEAGVPVAATDAPSAATVQAFAETAAATDFVIEYSAVILVTCSFAGLCLLEVETSAMGRDPVRLAWIRQVVCVEVWVPFIPDDP